jgi:hypothetical protein
MISYFPLFEMIEEHYFDKISAAPERFRDSLSAPMKQAP